METKASTQTAHPHRHRSLLMRQLHARPRLLTSLCVAILVFVLLPATVVPHVITRALLAWNVGACLYLLLAAVMLSRASQEHLCWRARVQDEGRIAVLAVTVLATLASLVAIFAELAAVKDMQGQVRIEHVALTVLTIVTAWCFVHLMFALHYAHDFYLDRGRGGDGGLAFPGTTEPGYHDFLYFACVIGTSGQTADVSFTSRAMRRIGLLHCILAYAFNTTVLALTINIASGLI